MNYFTRRDLYQNNFQNKIERGDTQGESFGGDAVPSHLSHFPFTRVPDTDTNILTHFSSGISLSSLDALWPPYFMGIENSNRKTSSKTASNRREVTLIFQEEIPDGELKGFQMRNLRNGLEKRCECKTLRKKNQEIDI